MRLVGYCSLLFFLSIFKSCAELEYAIIGKNEIAKVIHVRKSNSPHSTIDGRVVNAPSGRSFLSVVRAPDGRPRCISCATGNNRAEDPKPNWRVTYEFLNAQSQRMQQGYGIVTEEVSKNFEPGQKVLIEYRGDSILESRLKGNTNRWWVYWLGGSITLTVASVGILTCHSMLEEKRLRNRKWWIK